MLEARQIASLDSAVGSRYCNRLPGTGAPGPATGGVTVVAALPCDKHHWIKAGKVFAVCGNTFRMLAANRHYDLFEGVGRGCLRYVISF
jgi:hypothetical protein